MWVWEGVLVWDTRRWRLGVDGFLPATLVGAVTGPKGFVRATPALHVIDEPGHIPECMGMFERINCSVIHSCSDRDIVTVSTHP